MPNVEQTMPPKKLIRKMPKTRRQFEDIVNDVRAALMQLDHYRYNEPNADEAAVTESLLRDLQEELQTHMKSSENGLTTYPEYNDPNFYRAIFAKKEFNKGVYPPFRATSFEKIAHEQCSSGFRLSKNQSFLKNFLSPRTPYNGILLFHGVGVGKTCAAISIAEQFIDLFENQVLVLAPSNLSDNFKKQLFDPSRPDQCTTRKYLSKVPFHEHLDGATIEKHVGRLIRENYKFSGFIEFANHVEAIERTMIEKYGKNNGGSKISTPMADAKINAQLKKEYSNRVIIIDEVHNVRSDKEDPKKKTPMKLLRVLQAAENVKLIMLTATPMFNDTREIVWLLNFLLANDKRPLIEASKCFDETGSLTHEGNKILSEAARGYVSYMRGDNPFSFPTRLYASINGDPACLKKSSVPKRDMYGRDIEPERRLSLLVGKIVTCEMSGLQARVYKDSIKVAARVMEEDDNDEGEEFSDDQASDHSISKLIQMSNIVFPSKLHGKQGFDQCFEVVKEKGGNLRGYRYKKIDGKKNATEFLSPTHIGDVSTKLKSIVDYILNSEGIVYVYSFYIYSALLPLALALEHVGFKRSNGKSLLIDAVEKAEPFRINGKQAKYALLSRDADLYSDMASEVSKIRSSKNVNGEEVKVILGTNVTAEGIDFKNIRQIHIVEPWFHLNKLEQVVGRAVRKCSHIDLPIEKRNVTIYYHASSIKNTETIDLRVYKIAENKEKSIKEVERLLMSTAVDCALNKNTMSFPKDKLKMRIKQITSQGTMFDHDVGDEERDKHVGLKCMFDPDGQNNISIDEHTFHPSFYRDQFEFYGEHVASLFRKQEAYTFDAIRESLSQNAFPDLDEDVLKYALEHMLITRVPVYNSEKVLGFLVYFGNMYMFQPADAPEAFLTLGSRNMYKPLSVKEVRIAQKNVIKHTKTVIGAKQVMSSLIEKITKMQNMFPGFEQEVIDYCVDRLNSDEVKTLSVSIHNQENDTMLDLIEKSLRSGMVYVKVPSIKKVIVRDVSKADKSDELVPPAVLAKFDAAENEERRAAILIFNEHGQLDVPTVAQMASILSDKTLRSAREVVGQGVIKGFMGFNTEGPVFKIFGDEEKSNGFVCGTNKFKVDDYRSRILALDPHAIKDDTKHTKASLCTLYEMLLRKKAPEAFLRPFPAKIMEIRKKYTSKTSTLKIDRAIKKRGRPKK